jgi:dimethylaniline monooxygenase (N-oxide forming)
MMTQTPVGMFEYSSYPLKPPSETFYDYFSAENVSDYLDAFSQSKKFGGKTVKERIRFSSKATQISKEGSEWKIEVTNGTLYTCQELMMATGLTSTPDIPSLLCHGKCKPLVIHSKYLAKKSQFFPSPQIKNVVVLGGSKSAFDAVYMLSQAGKSVSWIIRTMGQGPANMVPPDVVSKNLA